MPKHPEEIKLEIPVLDRKIIHLYDSLGRFIATLNVSYNTVSVYIPPTAEVRVLHSAIKK